MVEPYRILLADDHKMFRQGIKKIIDERTDMEVVGEANDGLEVLNLMKKLSPELVIIDIAMPNMRGIEATHEIKSLWPHTKVMVLTMHKDKDLLSQAIAEGADAYLLKEDADIELFSAIETIRRGKHYISPLLSREVTSSFIEMAQGHGKSPDKELTVREREVLKLIAEGKSSKEIAETLSISTRTADNHRTHIMRKLGSNKNIDLVKYAIRKGYTDSGTG
jgi:DNA-binding NarL/FixJ family response regulator